MVNTSAFRAIDQLKKGDLGSARDLLDVSESHLGDDDFATCLMALNQGLELTKRNRLHEALEHLQTAIPLAEASSDQGLKTLVSVLVQYAEGIVMLHRGDAQGALQSLEAVSDTLNQLSFFDDEFEKHALGAEVGACVALAKANLNGGNLEGAEQWFGRTEDKLRSLSEVLDEDDPADAPSWSEVYGLPVEFSSLWAMHDLQALDTEQAIEHLERSSSEIENLEDLLPELQNGPTRDVNKANIIINRSLRNISSIADGLFREGERISRGEIEEIKETITRLREAKKFANRAGSRAQGYNWMIDQLIRFSRNLLESRDIGVRDFGKYSGTISFFVFVAILIVIHFTISPSAWVGLGYIFASLLIALAAGFGYGAIEFVPLIRAYRNVIKELSKSG